MGRRAERRGIVPNTNGAVTSAVLVHLRVEPAHFDWRWRERPALALLAWEALARDPLARLRRIQVESIGTTINLGRRAITNRDIAAPAWDQAYSARSFGLQIDESADQTGERLMFGSRFAYSKKVAELNVGRSSAELPVVSL